MRCFSALKHGHAAASLRLLLTCCDECHTACLAVTRCVCCLGVSPATEIAPSSLAHTPVLQWFSSFEDCLKHAHVGRQEGQDWSVRLRWPSVTVAWLCALHSYVRTVCRTDPGTLLCQQAAHCDQIQLWHFRTLKHRALNGIFVTLHILGSSFPPHESACIFIENSEPEPHLARYESKMYKQKA